MIVMLTRSMDLCIGEASYSFGNWGKGGGCDWGRAVIVYVTLHIVEFNEGLLTASIYLRMAGMVRR